MADKNDAREFIHKATAIWHESPEMELFVAGLLTAYAAAVTQERDALRRTAQSLMEWDKKYPKGRHYGGIEFEKCEEGLTAIIEQFRAAAEESQPK